MTQIATQERLRQYIDTASNHDLEDLLQYVEKCMEPDVPYNKWDDPEFIAEMEARVRSLEEGTDRGRTWEEVKENARKVIKTKNKK